MADEKVQIIVIGAGLAGIAAAYRLAKAGKKVVLVERGEAPGAKNVSGGRLYTYALEKLMPEEWERAPFEREISREMLMMMNKSDSIIIDSTLRSNQSKSYSVLRSQFDSWLASKAEEAGAMVIPATTVDNLIINNGKVSGIKTGDEELKADLIIDAEGVNALLAERAGIVQKVSVANIALGVKCVYQLSQNIINERFNVSDHDGVAMLCAGECTKKISGGAFFYTNKSSISAGIVVDLASLKESGFSVTDMLRSYISHPSISRYLKEGELREYSAHLIPEGGYYALPHLYSDGFLLVGDAAGLVVNRGFTVRGMDYAILSGIAAADTAIEAIKINDFSEKTLKLYQDKLDPVISDLKILKKSHDYIGHSPLLFNKYPDFVIDLMKNLYTVDGTSVELVSKVARQLMKKRMSLFSVLKDVYKGSRSL
ncbi:MAG: FAD-dependent oxidoreductase [Sporolactobacillus sp.]|jgi:electron transfer flavoprotein-quinone oxidoreductase|nr:FAD-dependent oxidoreductase [Sporolactobacillus sp.]